MSIHKVTEEIEACLVSLDSLVMFSKTPHYNFKAKTPAALWQHQFEALQIVSDILGINNNVGIPPPEPYLSTDSPNTNAIQDGLEELEIELMEIQGLVRYGLGDVRETSPHRESEDVSVTAAGREARALQAVISTDVKTVEVWSRYRKIAQRIG
ncbi:MAG: hypothetical protein Q9216_006319, partial [Gyalolechia sp. 2 TL-2023]